MPRRCRFNRITLVSTLRLAQLQIMLREAQGLLHWTLMTFNRRVAVELNIQGRRPRQGWRELGIGEALVNTLNLMVYEHHHIWGIIQHRIWYHRTWWMKSHWFSHITRMIGRRLICCRDINFSLLRWAIKISIRITLLTGLSIYIPWPIRTLLPLVENRLHLI